jgi:serine O-acetyltransferase
MSLLFSREVTFWQKCSALIFAQGVQALLIFRLAHAMRSNWLLRKFRIHSFLYRLNQLLCGVDIDPEASIGRRFCMPHPTGIVIGATAEIGDDVVMMQQVTIGSRYFGEVGRRHATIHDGVFIGPGAIVLGAVTIGAGVQIGAGSLVLADVAAGQSIFGLHTTQTGS